MKGCRMGPSGIRKQVNGVSCTTCTSVYFCISAKRNQKPNWPKESILVHCGCPRCNFNAIFMRSFWLPILLFPPYSYFTLFTLFLFYFPSFILNGFSYCASVARTGSKCILSADVSGTISGTDKNGSMFYFNIPSYWLPLVCSMSRNLVA